MGVKFVGWVPSCEEVIFLYEMLILVRIFIRFTRNTLTSVAMHCSNTWDLRRPIWYRKEFTDPISNCSLICSILCALIISIQFIKMTNRCTYRW